MTKATVSQSDLPIPHRDPFLFVDKVIELDQHRILTQKQADPEADFFKGHYPGNPVMPGVLICESVFQAGAILIAHRVGQAGALAGTPVLTRIKEAKFKHIVKPGQTMNVEVVFDEALGDAFFLTGRVTVEGKMVLRVTFACMLAEEKAT